MLGDGGRHAALGADSPAPRPRGPPRSELNPEVRDLQLLRLHLTPTRWPTRWHVTQCLHSTRPDSQVLRLLRTLHLSGYVHNDIKPANLLLGAPGAASAHRTHLVDFGIATPVTMHVRPSSRQRASAIGRCENWRDDDLFATLRR